MDPWSHLPEWRRRSPISQGDTPCGERRDDPKSQIPDSRFTLQTPIAELQAERGVLPGAFPPGPSRPASSSPQPLAPDDPAPGFVGPSLDSPADWRRPARIPLGRADQAGLASCAPIWDPAVPLPAGRRCWVGAWRFLRKRSRHPVTTGLVARGTVIGNYEPVGELSPNSQANQAPTDLVSVEPRSPTSWA